MLKTIKITGDSIPLPKRLAKKWRGARAEISDRGIRVIDVKPSTAGRLQAWRQLKPLAGTITQREIRQVIADVRSKHRE